MGVIPEDTWPLKDFRLIEQQIAGGGAGKTSRKDKH